MWSRLRFDLTVALRSMRRQPVFTLVVFATLAVGIGANTAMFDLVHAALLKPLPYKDPDRLVLARRTVSGAPRMWNSSPDYYDYRAQTAGFEALAACGAAAGTATVTGRGRPERVPLLAVSHDLFPTLGVAPIAGRLFAPSDGRAGAPHVVIVNARLAERRFGSARAAVGQPLAITGLAPGGAPATIVGVMPTSFRFFEAADMWVPIREGEHDGPETRRFHNWVLIGRLKPGVSMATVQGQLDVISRRLQQQYPETNKVKALRVDPLQATLLRSQTPRLLVLMGAVGVVLLIACANVAGMLLARGVARRSELAVRAALGASRGRIAAQLLTESALLSGVSGIAGVALSLWLRRLLPIATGLAEAGVEARGMEGQVLLFALAATLATGLLSGAAPAIRASAGRLAEHLSPGNRATESRSGSRLRSLLVGAQVALSLFLLVGAGLLVRSLAGLMTTDLGFAPTGLLATTMDLAGEDDRARVQFQELLLDDLAAIPGVTQVTFTSHMPFLEPWGDPPVWRADHPPSDASQERTALARRVAPGFFGVLGIPLRSGRDLLPTDRLGTPLVVVVNEAFVREFFGAENPLGQRVVVTGGPQPRQMEIVGVVGDARTEAVGRDPFPTIYTSANQTPLSMRANLLLRSSLPPDQLTRAVGRAVAARDPELPVDPLIGIGAIVGDSLVPQRVTTVTLASFSGVALLLAALGLYGVLAQHVIERRHEIGVRLSLGAGAGALVRSVLWRSALMVVPGLAAGLVASMAGTRLVAGLLYGVPPTDPATFAFVSAGLVIVAVAASLVPAWRAARVDPVQALRGE